MELAPSQALIVFIDVSAFAAPMHSPAVKEHPAATSPSEILGFAAPLLLVGVEGLPMLGSFTSDGRLHLNFLQRSAVAAYLIIQ